MVAAWLALLELWLALDDDWLELLLLEGWFDDEAAELLEVAGWLLDVAGMLPVVDGSLVAAVEFDEDDGWLEALDWLDDAGWFDEDAGWLALVELEADAPPEMPSAARVCWSSEPDPDKPCACWKLVSAAWVFGPILPSIGPGSWPLSFSACWTCFTCESADDEDEDIELFGVSIEVLGWLADALVDEVGAGWLAAIAAVIERAKAVRANFRIMVNSFLL